ncbi:MAG: acyl-CoA dehydrogenase C-terminal domain-containing protein [Myxococcota bacterium]
MSWLQNTNVFLEQHKNHATLGDVASQVDKAKLVLADVTMNFVSQAKQDPQLVIIGATPYLRMFGHVEVANVLLEQAVLAADKLSERVKGVVTPEILRGDPEARFYDQKVKTARFFASTVLPEAIALGKAIKAGDRSALDIVF